MSDKYIRCNGCGNKIYFDDTIYFRDGYCGTYCSAECFADAYADIDILTIEHADNCMCKIYDDEVVAKRKAEIIIEIERLTTELKQLDQE